MYGAFGLPRISPRLWFSITIVNTVPPFHCVATTAGVLVRGSHTASTFPEVFAQPINANAPKTAARERFDMPDKHVLDVLIGKRNVCGTTDKTSTQSLRSVLPSSLPPPPGCSSGVLVEV